MALNPYINNWTASNEQSLIEDIIIESIKFYGYDVKYCPRTLQSVDSVFNEDAVSTYDSAYDLEMYVKNVEGFEGEGDFLSKFGVQIRDEITFTVAQSRYDTEVGTPTSTTRPQEGDLIYFGLTGKIYQVKFVEHEPIFYQIGALQTYDLRCELFEYSNEKLDTGVSAIDDIETKFSQDISIANSAAADANGNIIIDANTGRPVSTGGLTLSDNDEFQVAASGFIDFSEADPFSEGGSY